MKIIQFLGLFLLLVYHVSCKPLLKSDYVDCIVGDLNVILAAPHGGNLNPSTIRDRDAGCFIDGQCVWSHDCGNKDSSRCSAVTSADVYTWELTERMAYYLDELTGKTPTMVINMLHRRKLDANRDINEATFGEAEAVEAWEAFHSCINQTKSEIESSPIGKGLFFDIHGHGHPDAWAELGYLISGANLDSGNFRPEDTSIHNLHNSVGGDFEELLRGPESYGGFLESNGFRSVPAPGDPGPQGRAYFSGGYNTRIHGSRDGGSIDAIQIESARVNRDPPMREAYAEALARSIVQYMEAWNIDN